MITNLFIDKIAQLIDEEPYDCIWMSYKLRDSNNRRLKGTIKRGEVVQIKKRRDTSINNVLRNIKEKKYEKMVGFSIAILLFFGERVYKKMKFTSSKAESINGCLTNNQTCPIKYREQIYDICHLNNIDFVEYIKEIHKTGILSFDLDATLKIYELQGEDAIFGILCQIFYKNDDIEIIYPGLIPNIPIKYDVEISDYISGCNFPVVVSPKVTKFKCEDNINGWYLYAKYNGKWHVMDVFGVGHNQLFKHKLLNRLNFLGGGGQALPFWICHNWDELIEAVRHFGGNGLIRDLNNDLFDHYWYNFGLDSLINVKFFSVYLNPHTDFAIEARGLRTLETDDKVNYLTINLRKQLINECRKEDIVFTAEEIYDFFEIVEKIK